MEKKQKHTLLLGEGVHQHTLYGNFMVGNEPDFTEVNVMEESLLKHEHPNGNFGEHQTLKVESGEWVMGKQVEYNPFNQSITRIWD
jgi:D-Tyr-tRNAtyr deacylase